MFVLIFRESWFEFQEYCERKEIIGVYDSKELLNNATDHAWAEREKDISSKQWDPWYENYRAQIFYEEHELNKI